MQRSKRQYDRLEETREIEQYLMFLARKSGVFTKDLKLNPDEYGIDIIKFCDDKWRVFGDIKGSMTCFIDYKNGEEITFQNSFYIFKEKQILRYKELMESGVKHLNYWLLKLYDLNTTEVLNQMQNEWFQYFKNVHSNYEEMRDTDQLCVIREEVSLYTVNMREVVDIYENTNLWRKLKLKEETKKHYVDPMDSTNLIKISRDHLNGTLINLLPEWKNNVPAKIKEHIQDFYRRETY